MTLFGKFFNTDGKYIQTWLCITFQANIAFKLSFSPNVPFALELGLGLITIEFNVFKVIK